MKNKIILSIILVVFLCVNPVYSADGSRQFFKEKTVDREKLSTQAEDQLQKRKSALKAKTIKPVKRAADTKKVISANLDDISQIHIPSEIGKVVEVYQAEAFLEHSRRLIVHIQDLHTNPEGQLNLANILDILMTDYGLDLVCSEGAEGEVNTSTVSSFSDPEVREKTAELFINSGELTGEEYLSITKYPDMPIWGIEDKDIYFSNIIKFNEIMRYNEKAEALLSLIYGELKGLKNRVYSKELIGLEEKQAEYAENIIESTAYLEYLNNFIKEHNLSVPEYKNIDIFNETLRIEKNIDHEKIKQQSQNLVMALQARLSDMKRTDVLDSFTDRAQVFKDKKISALAFYTYLKDTAVGYMPDKIQEFQRVMEFVDYLAKLNSLDSMKVFTEIDELAYEVKQLTAKTQEQKRLVEGIRKIQFVKDFFDLKISNDDMGYYFKDKESFKLGWFKALITDLKGQVSEIDFDTELIDERYKDLEDFYEIVRKRDKAMIHNALSEIKRRDAKVVALVSGGFHTKGITEDLREQGFSYIVAIPYSSSEIDEENYRNLLAGKRRSITDITEELNKEK